MFLGVCVCVGFVVAVLHVIVAIVAFAVVAFAVVAIIADDHVIVPVLAHNHLVVAAVAIVVNPHIVPAVWAVVPCPSHCLPLVWVFVAVFVSPQWHYDSVAAFIVVVAAAAAVFSFFAILNCVSDRCSLTGECGKGTEVRISSICLYELMGLLSSLAPLILLPPFVIKGPNPHSWVGIVLVVAMI